MCLFSRYNLLLVIVFVTTQKKAGPWARSFLFHHTPVCTGYGLPDSSCAQILATQS